MTTPSPEPEREPVVDLMAALSESVAAAKADARKREADRHPGPASPEVPLPVEDSGVAPGEPERRWVHDGLFGPMACTPENPCGIEGLLCGWSSDLVDVTPPAPGEAETGGEWWVCRFPGTTSCTADNRYHHGLYGCGFIAEASVPPAPAPGEGTGRPGDQAACDRLTAWLRATHDGSCRICGRGNDLVDQHADDCEAAPVIALALGGTVPAPPAPQAEQDGRAAHTLSIDIEGGGWVGWKLNHHHTEGWSGSNEDGTPIPEDGSCWVADHFDIYQADLLDGDWPENITFPAPVRIKWEDDHPVVLYDADAAPAPSPDVERAERRLAESTLLLSKAGPPRGWRRGEMDADEWSRRRDDLLAAAPASPVPEAQPDPGEEVER